MSAAREKSFAARTLSRIGELDAAAWDRLHRAGNPFLLHDFLDALEESGCCSAKTGWLPRHIAVEDASGALVAAMPLYLKNHSYGEYVFDYGWADAFQRAGGQYYPKLQCSVPFTPVTGARLLTAPGRDAAHTRRLLVSAAVQLAERLDASSVHVTFPTEDEWRGLGEAGFLRRTGEQFHWRNRGYGSFDEFLATLNARKRKMIRRERAAPRAAGIEIETLSGGDLRAEHWDAFHGFYMNTGRRKWGAPYLNRAFFALLHERMADRVALIMCRRDGRYIAGALNLIGGDTLFGRHWGCIERHDFLHFEACYYRAIDFAIARGLEWVEAGAQGPHKIQRGYMPRRTYSAHWIVDPRLRDAVADYLEHERRHVDWEIEAIERDFSPYRKDGPRPPA